MQQSHYSCSLRIGVLFHHNRLPQTYPHRYLHYSSHHHSRQLLIAICSLRDRAHKVCAISKRQEELAHLTKVFRSNGYPRPLVRRTLARTPPATSEEEEEGGEDTGTERPRILCLPYVRGLSERIEQGCRQLGVRVVFRSGHKLRQSLMRVKAAVNDDMKKGVVPCGECEHVYIGETGQNLNERLKEHQYAVKKKNMNNEIAAHASQHQHTVDWDARRVRCKESQVHGTALLEEESTRSYPYLPTAQHI